MYVHVKVKAGAKVEELVEGPKGLSISVTERAERNMANRRVLELVARHYGVPTARLISGHHSPSKIVDVTTTESEFV